MRGLASLVIGAQHPLPALHSPSSLIIALLRDPVAEHRGSFLARATHSLMTGFITDTMSVFSVRRLPHWLGTTKQCKSIHYRQRGQH